MSNRIHRSVLSRSGMVLVYSIVLMTLLIAMASLAVDFGRAQLAKAEASRTADAAARAAISSFSQGVAAAQSAALTIATANKVDGNFVTLDSSSDIEFGYWDNSLRTFAILTGTNRSNANAVRVHVRRTAARGNPVPLAFAGILGIRSIDISASATALQGSGGTLQLVGIEGISVFNNFFGGTYHSSRTTAPAHDNYEDGALAMSNKSISAFMNEVLAGVILGPNGTSNMAVPNVPLVLANDLSFPLPTGQTSTTHFNISGTVYMPGGTYYVSDLTIGQGGTLQFTGPATVYFSGNVNFDGNVSILAYNNIPGNLKLYHTGSGSFGNSSANNTTITADVYCPGVDFFVKNNALLSGRFIFKTITAKNNLDFYYDESLPPMYALPTTTSRLVK